MDVYRSWTTLTETSQTPSQISVHNMARNDNDLNHASSHFHGTLPSSDHVNVKKSSPEKSRSDNNSLTRDLSPKGRLGKSDSQSKAFLPKGHEKSTNPYTRLYVPTEPTDLYWKAVSRNQLGDDTSEILAKPDVKIWNGKLNHTSLIVGWNSEISLILTFSPYWKTPFHFDWVRFPNDSFPDIIAKVFPSKEHDLRERSALNHTVEAPLTMCPFSKRLAFVTTQRNSAWGRETYRCVIYDDYFTDTMTRFSPLIGDRKCQLLALSPDGRYAALGGDANGYGKHIRGLFSVTIIRLLNKTMVHELQIPAAPSAVKAMSFDSDSNRLAVLREDKNRFLISLYTCEFKSKQDIYEHVIVKHWNPRQFAKVSLTYSLSPILLFLPEGSIIIMFHTEELFQSAAKPLAISGSSAVVDTISRTSDTLVVQPEGRIHGIRIMREQWEAGNKPIVVESTSPRS